MDTSNSSTTPAGGGRTTFSLERADGSHSRRAERPRAAEYEHGKSTFRPDIEGLRAIAVVPILLNHALVRGFPGGFVGVDIFFVISGYLITGILVRDLATGAPILGEFYRRRILRIFPALFAMLALSTILAWHSMTPNELVAYARSLLATSWFSSNVQFYVDTGYFASEAKTRPLLHTWSLAVEEQFYILWPLLMGLVAARGRAATVLAMAGTSLLSLALAQIMVHRDMSAAFYLLPFRAWELGIGGILAVTRFDRQLPRIVRQILGVAGLGAIAYAIRSYVEPVVFPGLSAMPPCLGALAIIAAGPDTVSGWLLSFAPIRYVGRISYSLYLWHWPVIVFARLWLFLPSTPPVIVGEIAVSLVVAALSHQFIEHRLRTPLDRLPTRSVLIVGGATIAVTAALCAILLAAQGFPARFTPARLQVARMLDLDEEAAYRRGSCFVVDPGDRFDAATCLGRHKPGRSLLLIGDSAAAHLWPGLAARANRYDLRQATMVGCRANIVQRGDTPCDRFTSTLLRRWAQRPDDDAIMLAGNWEPKDLVLTQQTMAAFRRAGKTVILVGPMPRYTAALPRLLFFGNGADPAANARRNLEPNVWSIDRNMRMAALAAGATYISPLALLCPAGRCRVWSRPGVPLQFDYLHLTREGSALLVGKMMPQIDAALAASSPARRR